MRPLYEDVEDDLEIFNKNSSHISPHLHTSIECIYVTQGTLEVGIMQELFHMETGDFAMVAPDLIHHYQVFDSSPSKAIYVLAAPALSGIFLPTLQQSAPANPVIPAKHVHPDIIYAMNHLETKGIPELERTLHQAFIQIILARSLPLYDLVAKSTFEANDLISQTVSYIASHFAESVTLTDMARDLGVSPYALSRVFSGTFHRNFNQYLNEVRLDYACSLLHYTSQSITEVCGNAGFESQRTFNRVFKETYHMNPREYRKKASFPFS